LDYEDRLQMGLKIAEEGQANIYDAKFEGDDRAFVLKVFQDDTSLVDLESLWPQTMLPLPRIDYQSDWKRRCAVMPKCHILFCYEYRWKEMVWSN
jgi:hypothetical protein